MMASRRLQRRQGHRSRSLILTRAQRHHWGVESADRRALRGNDDARQALLVLMRRLVLAARPVRLTRLSRRQAVVATTPHVDRARMNDAVLRH